MFLELPTIEILVVTFVVTTIRIISEASPTILGGVMLAAYIQTQVEPSQLKTLFPENGTRGLLRVALIGMAMPVCAIGVLPVLRELKRLGFPASKLITLGVTAPLLNPFSILYGISVLSSTQCLMIAMMFGIMALTIGDVSSRFALRDEVNASPRPAGLTGGTRLRNLLIASGQLVTGRTLLDLLATIMVSALTAAWIRDGAIYPMCDASNRAGPALAMLLALPQYVSPARGIIQFAGIGNANLSIAAGLSIYVFGTGIGFAGFVGFARCYGLRRLLTLLLAVFLIMGLVTSVVQFVMPTPVGAVAETSALDALTRPGSSSTQQISMALKESLLFLDPIMISCAIAVGGLFVTGLVVRWTKTDFRDDDPEAAAQQNAERMSKAIPPSQLGAVSVVGIALLFTLSAYVLFPGPAEFLEEMDNIHLDANIAIRGDKVDLAIDRLVAWDTAAARLPIGAAIRGSFPTPAQRQTTRDLRTELHNTQELLRKGDLISAKRQLSGLTELLSETKATFDGGES